MAQQQEIPGQVVEVPLQLPMALALRWSVQTQYVVSERMMLNLMSILTPDQVAALEEASVEFQPVVFPKEGVVVR
jgi:hypothetical protein